MESVTLWHLIFELNLKYENKLTKERWGRDKSGKNVAKSWSHKLCEIFIPIFIGNPCVRSWLNTEGMWTNLHYKEEHLGDSTRKSLRNHSHFMPSPLPAFNAALLWRPKKNIRYTAHTFPLGFSVLEMGMHQVIRNCYANWGVEFPYPGW